MSTIRVGIEDDLQRLSIADLERMERDAYERIPEDPSELAVWDRVAAWPQK
ncbi:MAG TPA: hypothetical protein VHX14_15110 [Thermoanaerobaculia bacterium]|nr:hypothetical protein [Thermoanaerobaculia bacterium]